MNDGTTTVTIAVCTFRRNEQLRSIIPQLVRQGDSLDPRAYTAEVLVVDNNPGADAREVVESIAAQRAAAQGPVPSGTALRYVHEPRPGLSAARNACLSAAAGDLLAFIDDDEEPSENWLSALVEAQAAFDQPAIVGPILVRYETPPSDWILEGRCFVRPRYPTGTRRPAGYTSNLLLDLRFLRRHGLRFREEFGLSGGEDTMLTREMIERGGEVVWCDEAPVTDVVPTERINREWVLNRRYRMGISDSRCTLLLQPEAARRQAVRITLLMGGAVRYLVGAAIHTLGRARGSLQRDAEGAMLRARGRGLVAGALGRRFEEYSRTPVPAQGRVPRQPTGR